MITNNDNIKTSWKPLVLCNHENKKVDGEPIETGVRRVASYSHIVVQHLHDQSTMTLFVEDMTSMGSLSHTRRSTALVMCYSTEEYASLMCCQSNLYTKHVDLAWNKSRRLITEFLKTTNIQKVHVLAGIAPPSIKREIIVWSERTKRETDYRHMLQVKA